MPSIYSYFDLCLYCYYSTEGEVFKVFTCCCVTGVHEYSRQINGSSFNACIFCWDRTSCLAISSANTLRIPVFKAYCHVQPTFYWEESPYRYPTGKSYVIQSLRFQSARFWLPF